MKTFGIIIPILTCSILLFSCSPIPDKSIFAELSQKELAKALQSDPKFEDMYNEVHTCMELFSELEKAKYQNITWKNLYKIQQLGSDSVLWNNWREEWTEKFSSYDGKVDSVIDYWLAYQEKNSLDRFVKIEFVGINKKYYSYIDRLEDVYFVFRLTPLNGPIEQIRFNYRYSLKINNYYGKKHYCLSTSPFSKPDMGYWKVDYLEKDNFENITTQSFIRDYNLKTEITDIRKNGVNYSINDFKIPASITDYLENDNKILDNYYRTKIIKDQIYPLYKRQGEYLSEKWAELLKASYPKEFEFLKLLGSKADLLKKD